MLKNLHCVRGTSFIFLFKADLRVMGRFERTSDPLLCEQKELSIVAKSFFILHCAFSDANVNNAVRNLFTIFDFPKSDWRRLQRTDFVRSGVETISTPRRTKFVRRDFTQFLIYITIDCKTYVLIGESRTFAY